MVSVAGPEIPDDAAFEWPPRPSRTALAWRDLAGGFIRSGMWWTLAFQDIKLRYRGSALGPFWLTLSMLFLVVGMGTIYSHLLNTQTHAYMPYLTVGLITWQYINTLAGEACHTFLLNDGVIQQVPIPFSIHAYRVVCRNLIVLGHTLVIVPLVLLYFAIPVGWSMLGLIPAAAMLAINGVWLCLFLGMITARFRDVAPIVNSVFYMAFFLTPVIWPLESLGPHRWMAEFNPLFTLIDVVRAPLLGVPTQPYSWPALIFFTALGAGMTFALFARFRHRIAFWV